MKKLFTFLMLSITVWAAYAQCNNCSPLFQNCSPTGGLCAKLDTAYANNPYDKTITFYMPKTLNDPSILAQCGGCNSVRLRNIRVTGVSGLPAGFQTPFFSNNGQYNVQNGDSLGCARFCGTPLLPGMYQVTVFLLADVTAIGTPVGNVDANNQPQSYIDTLWVLPDTVAGVSTFTYGNSGTSACNTVTLDLEANKQAQQPNLTRYFWDLGNGTTTQAKKPGIVNYNNTSGNKPDTFNVVLRTVFYNYRIKKVHISNITGGYCGDVEELTCLCASGADSPDPYLTFSVIGFNNSGNNASNRCTNVNFDNLNLSIPEGTFSLNMQIWDKDNGPPFGSQDDNLGTYTINIGLGQVNYSNNNAFGYVEIDTIAGTILTDTLKVITYPTPVLPVVAASLDTFCSNDSVLLSIGAGYPGYVIEWWRDDTVYLSGIEDAEFYSNIPGQYKARVTDAVSGCQNISVNKTIVSVPGAPNQASVLFNGTQLFLTPFPASGFAARWFYNGNLVSGQSGKFLPYLGNGTYEAEIYNIAFPSCAVVAEPRLVEVSGLGDEAESLISTFTLAPNPSNGIFNVSFAAQGKAAVSLQVSNAIGQVFVNSQFEHQNDIVKTEVNLQQFGKGVYYVTLVSGNNKVTKLAVVQ